MNDSKPVILYLGDQENLFIPNKKMMDKFDFNKIAINAIAEYEGEAMGIILVADEILESHYKLLQEYAQIGHEFALSIISTKIDPHIYSRLSMLTNTVWFSVKQLSEASEDTLNNIYLFFKKNKNLYEYHKLLKEHSLGNDKNATNSMNIVAHQWRQPLNIISMEAINLSISANIDSVVNSSILLESSSIINEQVQRMSQILKSVLDLGKANKIKKEFMTNELLENIEKFFKEELKQEFITLNIGYLEDDLPIYGYQTDLEEVIINIVSNAKDAYAMEQTKEKKQIRIDVSFDNDNLYLAISDAAGGIPKSIRDKIFEPNFSTKAKGVGFGIGLHVAKLIIEQEFKGSLTLHVSGNETKFLIKIPRYDLKTLKLINS